MIISKKIEVVSIVLGIAIGVAATAPKITDVNKPFLIEPVPAPAPKVEIKPVEKPKADLELVWGRFEQLKKDGPLPRWLELKNEVSNIKIIFSGDSVFASEHAANFSHSVNDVLDLIGSILAEDNTLKINMTPIAETQVANDEQVYMDRELLALRRAQTASVFLLHRWQVDLNRVQREAVAWSKEPGLRIEIND